jgi:tetratricopeptide (TPR) repeat protein
MNAAKLALALGVAASCAGCVTETKTFTASPDTASKMNNIKEADYTKREAKPATWVAVGELRESNAADPKVPPLQQTALREEARDAYQQAIKIDPKCVQAYLHLANLYMRQDDPERAIAVYQQALQQNPKVAQLWYEKGTLHGQRKDFGPALQCLGKAHELEPQTRLYATQYGLCLALRQQPQEAVKVMCRVMNKAEANYYVARLMDQINQPEASRQYLQAALIERPTYPAALKLMTELNDPNPRPSRAATLQFDGPVQRASWNAQQ